MDMGLWSNLPIRLAPAPGYAALPRASYGLASSGLAKSWRFGSEERRRRGRTRAQGASRGYSNTGRSSPGGAKQPQQPTCSVSVSPLRGSRIIPSRFPQLAPWAQVLSRLRRFSETPSTDTGNVTTGTDTGNVTTGTDTGNVTTGTDTGNVTTGTDTGNVTTGTPLLRPTSLASCRAAVSFSAAMPWDQGPIYGPRASVYDRRTETDR